ncbi:MAG: hypothetical protein AAGI38_02565 [Bacteroidota bacterium]
MGVDLRFVLKKDRRKKEIQRIPMSRPFCALIGNTKYLGSTDFRRLEKIVGMDLAIILELEYDDPEEALYWTKLADIGDTSDIKRNAWLSQRYMKASELKLMISELLEKLRNDRICRDKLKSFKANEWVAYVEKEFLDDLAYLSCELDEKIADGFKWVSVEIGH